MLSCLFPDIKWDIIECIGFDLDGTLFDEFEFIQKVYREIVSHVFYGEREHLELIHSWMVTRWVEKGSSYPHIFEESLSLYNKNCSKKETISSMVEIFRNFVPMHLTLPARIKYLLELISKKYDLFIVTDGQSSTQRHKIEALGLKKWFKDENICISGEHNSHKPDKRLLEKIQCISLKEISKNKIIYLGDREVDLLFAKECEMFFGLTRAHPQFANNLIKSCET